MSPLSTVSIPLIPIRQSTQRTIIFTIELLRGQALSLLFINSDIITLLVYEHTTVEPVVVQKPDDHLVVSMTEKELKQAGDT